MEKLFAELNFLTVPSLYILGALRYTKNNLHSFLRHGDIHQYGKWRRSLLTLEKHGSTFYERSVEYFGAMLYNHLPTDIKVADGNKAFINATKKLLKKKAFYSSREFFVTR